MIKAFRAHCGGPAETQRVFESLQDVDGIAEVYQVMGPYDIVAVIEAPSITQVPALISQHIRVVEGIESTTTCVTFPES